MKWLREIFGSGKEKEPSPPRETNFFCIYCNAKFKNSDLERVIAHLKPHTSKEEADQRLGQTVSADR